MQHASLFDFIAQVSVVTDPVLPVEPHPLRKDEWPPDYAGILVWRGQTLQKLRIDAELLTSAKAYYSTRPIEFINDWFDTYDPRRTENKWIPFVFFWRQAEFIAFLEDTLKDGESGLIEKGRDMGATWCCCAFSVWAWLFVPEIAIGWGSRKQDLVDRIGEPDSIFEKIRLLINRLPDVWLPNGWSPKDHATFMKLLNPANGATITGEAGDNIGRGGRKTIYFKDEAQPLTTGILTPSGWQTMGDMKPGSTVIGVDGNPATVIAVNHVGVAPVYRVSFSDGTSTECSENHLWKVQNKIGKKQVKTLRTNELLNDYIYNSPGGQTQYRYRIPVCKPVQFASAAPLPLHPWIVGALIGDGSVGNGCVKFASADPENVVRFLTHAPDGTSLRVENKYNWRFIDAGNRYTKVSRAKQAVIASGIYGKRAWEKFIPNAYKFASVDDRICLLRGLMDTDGSASGGVASYHTTSKQLADDVCFIVRSLGGTVTVNVKPDKRGFRDMYVLHMTIPGVVPFSLSRKIDKLRKRSHPCDKTIIAIDFIGQKEVRCITVDKADGLYLTDSFIVTHNSAHYERPEKIEAALGDNTNTQIDISSVNGLGNVFHRRREAGELWQPGKEIGKGVTRVFIMDWRDHPEKTQDWYDTRRAKYEREGMLHLFKQEVDRDYSAAVLNTVIPMEWINAAVNAHLSIKWRDEKGLIRQGLSAAQIGTTWGGALDVADGGQDKNALALRQGILWRYADHWGARDVAETTRRAVDLVKPLGRLLVQYDSIGVGAGVKGEYNRLVEEKLIDPSVMQLVPWNAGARVLDPAFRVIPDDENSILNEDMFENLKAQAWFVFRSRFYKTFRNIKFGEIYPIDEMVSIDGGIPVLHQLKKELAQVTMKQSGRLKTMIEKAPEGTNSPNIADAGVMMYFPLDPNAGRATTLMLGAS